MTHELEAMIKAVETEKKRMLEEWETIGEAKNKLSTKRQRLREDKKLIDEALRKLASIDNNIDRRLSKADNLVEDSSRIRNDCRKMMDDCKAIESSRSNAIAEAKGTWPMFSLQNVNKQLLFFKNVNKQRLVTSLQSLRNSC